MNEQHATWLWQTGTWLVNWLTAHHKVIDTATETIAICSFLHTMLPPWDWNPDFASIGLREFPKAQHVFYGAFNNRYYRIFVYSIGYLALNARSTVWRFISVNNQSGPNANTPTMTVQTVTSEKVTIPVDPQPPAQGGQ